MHRARGLLLTAACLTLVACGSKTPTGQVVATVKGKEVTAAELRSEMGNFNAPNAQVRHAAEEQVLNQILARKVLAQAAEKAGISKSPEYALQKQKTDEALLVQVWQAQIAKSVPNPSKEEVDKFVNENPDLYSARKIFIVEQIRFPRISDPKIVAGFKDLKTLPDVAAYLTANKVPFQQGNGNFDALQLGPDATGQITKLPAGEVFIIPANGLFLANRITETKVAPVPADAAAKQASGYLKNKRTQEAIRRQFSQILAAGKKDIKYAKAYEPPPAPKAGAAPAALIFSAAARTSRQVLGRAVVDSPAFSKASRFSHITAEEELNGIEISRPWVSL